MGCEVTLTPDADDKASGAIRGKNCVAYCFYFCNILIAAFVKIIDVMEDSLKPSREDMLTKITTAFCC